MIIINYNDNDPTVYPVIDWLHYLNFDFKIISVLAHLQCVSMSKDNACPVLAHKQHVSIHNIAEFN